MKLSPTTPGHWAVPVFLATAALASAAQTGPFADAPRDADVAGGAGTFVPDGGPDDDSIPLPVEGQVQDSDLGDTVIQDPSGDPFFLGFAAGKQYPPAGESVDPDLVGQVRTPWIDGRPTQETWAFVMFEKRITERRRATLEQAGCRILGFHPHYTLKVALPPAAIDTVAALPFVRWIGSPEAWQKVHPAFEDVIDSNDPAQILDVYVNVFDSDLNDASVGVAFGEVHEGAGDTYAEVDDPAALPTVWVSNGWQQAQLEGLGVEVLAYYDELRAFRGRVHVDALEGLTGADFVQFVEPAMPVASDHAESMSMVNADRVRALYDGGTTNSTVVGAVDSGVDLGHTSIDQYHVSWNQSGASGNGFVDACGHGTHVCGTIYGNDDVDDSYQGCAPLLGGLATRRLYHVKIFASCSPQGVDYATVLNTLDNDFTSGGSTTPYPHVVNNSWGSDPTSGGWIGTEFDARAIDNQTYYDNQLQVFSAGNDGSGAATCSIQSGAKTSMTVGNVVDYNSPSAGLPGNIWPSSSRGPTGDGRWKPNVTAPGVSIYSVQANTTTGYTSKTGTSMAAPHVTGVAAQLCDHYSFLRYNPPTLAAVLMAGAMTNNNTTLSTPSASHLDNYGTGRVDSYRSNYGTSNQALYFWGWTQGASGYTYVDVPISAGATRIKAVMTYTEPAASSGASSAVINDLDMWIDRPPIQAGGNTGEFSAQQSTANNTEVRMLSNPEAGTWRIKVYSDSVPGVLPKVGLCVIVSYGDLTPNGTLNVVADDVYVKPNENVTLTGTYYNPSHIAQSIFMNSSVSSGATLLSSTGTQMDGSTINYTGNYHNGWDVTFGNVGHGTTRRVDWTTRWSTEGFKAWSVGSTSENAPSASDSATVVVDGTAPGIVGSLSSSTHAAGVWDNQGTVQLSWTTASDNLSGIDGYGIATTTNAPGLPGTIKDINAVTGYSLALGSSSSPRYFNIRALDRSGNWSGSYANYGPILVDTIPPGSVPGLVSTSHTPGIADCDGTITMDWSPASDAHSGVAQYFVAWDASPSTVPTGTTTLLANQTAYTRTLGNGTWYFHVVAVDAAGSRGTTSHAGPFVVNDNQVQAYCTAKVNSAGCTPSVAGVNTPSKAAGNFRVIANNVLNNKVGLLFWGRDPLATPFQGGWLCVKQPVKRTSLQNSFGSPAGTDCTGSYSFAFDTAYMNAENINAGDTIYAQYWSRDPASSFNTNRTDALQFTVCR